MKALQDWLEGVGYTCKVATKTAEAWQALQDLASSLVMVIIDVAILRQFDGVQLLDRITALRKVSVRVIVISGEAEDMGPTGVQHISYDFITKPLVVEVLLQKINTLVQHRKLELQVESDRASKAAMRKAIEVLSERALHTPVQIVIDTITALLAKPNLTADLRADVESLRSLIVHNANMYRPLLKQVESVDHETRAFLFNQMLLDLPALEFAQPTPSIRLDDPLIQELAQWSFDVFKHPEDGLLSLVKQMFVHSDLLEHFNIREDVLDRFLETVRQMYKPVPYHNWLHAFDVTQAAFCFLVQFDGQTKLTHLDFLALLVSALCHDMSHPGVNNAHLVMTQSDLALLYNDRSVLENFHVSSLFQLLHQRKDVDIFASLSSQQLREVRRSITDCTLATDMAHHYEYVTKLGVRADTGVTEWERSDADQRTLLMQCIIKMADISNVARPWDMSVAWSRRIADEFFAQAAREGFFCGRAPVLFFWCLLFCV